mgnify:CR=1 FL=1
MEQELTMTMILILVRATQLLMKSHVESVTTMITFSTNVLKMDITDVLSIMSMMPTTTNV